MGLYLLNSKVAISYDKIGTEYDKNKLKMVESVGLPTHHQATLYSQSNLLERQLECYILTS